MLLIKFFKIKIIIKIIIITTIVVKQFRSFYLQVSNAIEQKLTNGRCQCYVPRYGIYNGIELNKYRRQLNCKPNVFYCGKYRGDAVLIRDCSIKPGCFHHHSD